MFVRIIKDSLARRPRRKLIAGIALALGTAVATATLTVVLDIGDKLAREFRSLGANLLVTPQADTLPLEIGGVDYRPVSSGAYLPESELGKLKTIFWRNNIVGFVPSLDVPVELSSAQNDISNQKNSTTLIGTWYRHDVSVPDGGGSFRTGFFLTNPWWQVRGRWFTEQSAEAVIGSTLASRSGISAGQKIRLRAGDRTTDLLVTGIASTGGREDDAIIAPLEIAQQISNRPGQYRRLLVSALTKPEDAFSRRDPKEMTPAEYDRWYCSPYISSISKQIQEEIPGVEVQPIRQVAEGEGRILNRVSSLMWLVTAAALLTAALAVAATAGTTVLERAEEIGLMKALGARNAIVGAFFLGEQWFIALLGGVVGYGSGLAFAKLLSERVFGISPEFRLILLPIVLAMALGVATIGSLLPLRSVIALDPAPVLRGE